MAGQQRRYEFGSAAEDDTLVAGVRAGQLALVAAGLLLAVVTIRAQTTARGFALAAAVVSLAAAAAFWHVGGRTVEQWVPVVGHWIGRRLLRRTRQVSASAARSQFERGRRTTAS